MLGMKIVYNACFGGFSLSDAANAALPETKRAVVYEPDPKYFTKYFTMSLANFNNPQCERSDLDLIALVERMGSEADGECASLAIATIPDGMHWWIDDYDGNETVCYSASPAFDDRGREISTPS
jgi:hypothetical protein